MQVIPWEESLSAEQKSLLIGCILGDGRLECRSKNGTARLRIHHADGQKEYLFWKYNLLKSWVDRPPWKTAWTDQRNGRMYVSWFFHTKTSPVFHPWWQLFYSHGTKHVPEDIHARLEPFAIAVWFMDDGCFQEKSIILNTQSFGREEQQRLVDYFRTQFGIRASFQKDRENTRLYFGASERRKIFAVIEPHLLPMFQKTFPVTTDPKTHE